MVDKDTSNTTDSTYTTHINIYVCLVTSFPQDFLIRSIIRFYYGEIILVKRNLSYFDLSKACHNNVSVKFNYIINIDEINKRNNYFSARLFNNALITFILGNLI